LGVPWATSSDVGDFLAAAGGFLTANPVDHTVLLTEAAYLAARPSSATDQRYGWWKASTGAVAGAFLQAPKHPPVLSTMPGEAVESLVDVLLEPPALGVDGRLVDAATAAWRGLRPHSRITLYRLGDLRAPQSPPGKARVATAADRDLLVSWFHQLMAAFPDDPSELAYVVDDPISYGGITMWEVDGVPRAMAGRSRMVAGMVRLGAVFAPQDGGDGDAAFVAACKAAHQVASDILVFGQPDDPGYRELGFAPILDRVMLRAP
jgi:hypothetical protein